MKLEIDTQKLAKLIEDAHRTVQGCCVTAGFCIGNIRGCQVQVVVQADEEEYMDELEKFLCVKETKE